MTIEEQILEEVGKGRQGLNHGISIGMPKLEGIMDGNTRETYTLIMSNSGAGKKFIFFNLGISKIIYYSLSIR